jgi:hypothetical protein
MAATRTRRRHGEVQVTVVLSERDLAKIARRGYADAASTDAGLQGPASAGLFINFLGSAQRKRRAIGRLSRVPAARNF